MKISNSKERIKALMTDLQLNQTDFCEKTGIQKSALSNYLNGNRVPRQDQISKIADAFGVSPSWLMGYDVPMYDSQSVVADDNRAMLLAYYDSFNDAGRAELLKYAKILSDTGSYKRGLSDSSQLA